MAYASDIVYVRIEAQRREYQPSGGFQVAISIDTTASMTDVLEDVAEHAKEMITEIMEKIEDVEIGVSN